MVLAGIETSCDETSVAIVQNGQILASTVSSQIKLHSEYGGVVPELATREHLRNLLPVARSALAEAGIRTDQLEAIAATRGPGLPPALNIGFLAGQALAYALGKRFIGIHHHEAHLYSPWICGRSSEFHRFQPNVSLIVSGGHTLLVHLPSEGQHQVLGSTIDDAAGECFDKTAKLLGLPYPGGPQMDRLARNGNPRAYPFPRPMLQDPGYDFSFSGLKTAVRYFLRDHPEIIASEERLADLAASVQAAIVEVLVVKTLRAARALRVPCVTASGGVTCNSGLRQALQDQCQKQGLELKLAEREWCTDNAGMIAVLAERKLERGWPATSVSAEIKPSWSLEGALAPANERDLGISK